MKKKLRILIVAALVIALSAGAGILAFSQTSDPTVTLNGSTQAFEFSNTVGAENDLFVNMKNVMPGDTIEQQIVVRATNIGNQTAQISLRVEPPLAETQQRNGSGNDYEELLNNDNVKLNVYNGGTLLSSDTLGTGVSLGGFDNNQSRMLTVRLVVDKKAGNELAGLQGEVDWVFYGEVTGGGGYIPDIEIPETEVPTGPLPELEKADHYAYMIGRNDGLVHPGANITRAEMATIFFRMLTEASRAKHWSQTNNYTDVSSGVWYNNAISTLTNAGVLKGRDNGRFEPNAPITRAEFAALLSRFYEAKYEGPDQFNDISGHWAAGNINSAVMNSLLEGYPDGTFRPNNYITRAEAATGLNRILGRTPSKDYLLPNMVIWPDNSDTGAWYYGAVQEATNSHHYEKVMEGSGIMYEKWTELRAVRNWATLETEWATLLGNRAAQISSR